MAGINNSDKEPVACLQSALEFLRDEAQRLKLKSVVAAIARVLVVLHRHAETVALAQSAGDSVKAEGTQDPPSQHAHRRRRPAPHHRQK